jgi:voltage-gated potassium channel
MSRDVFHRRRLPSGPYERARAATERFIHHPVTEMAIVVLIVASVIALVFESFYDFAPATYGAFVVFGDAVTLLFALELSARFWIARKKKRFFRRYWIDILAVLPITRALRLFRVLRLLRLFRAGALLNRRMTLFQGMFQGTLGELTLLGTLTVTLIFVGTVILYLVEDRGAFGDITGSLWFSLFSLVAGEPIGGDPESNVGRLVTLGLMFGGMTLFGIFVGTISASMVARLSKRGDVQELDLDELTDHVILCGWNASGPLVLQELFGGGSDRRLAPVVLITQHAELPANLPSAIVRRELLYHLSGDYTKVEVLERANIRAAAAAIVLADSQTPRSEQDRDARTVLAALTIERLCPGIFTCAELCNRDNGELLKLANVDEIVVPEEYSGVILGSVGRNRGLVRVFDEILSSRYGNSFHKIALPDAWTGRTIRDLFVVLKEQHDAVLVSIEAVTSGNRSEPHVNPPLDHRIEPNSRIVVLARAEITL